MDKFTIATGLSRMTKLWRNTEITWEELVQRLSETTRTPESQGEFRNMTKAQQDNVKDVGGFVGGKVIGGRRCAGQIAHRSLLTLDADFADAEFCENIELLANWSYIIYSTHKHTAEKPRLRLIIPLSRPCSPEEYEAIGRMVAYEIGIDQFDDTTYQAHRLMYWPSTSRDGEFVFRHSEHVPLDADEVLFKYKNWHDIKDWPVSSRTVKVLERRVKQAEDPETKHGVVGAFCRTYTIDELIDEHFGDLYVPAGKNRYTYTGGSTTAGLIIYNDGKFAYSNHATDPISEQLLNAFDFFRLLKFGALDEDAKDGTPTVKMPSYVAMCNYAANDKNVKKLLLQERVESSKADFEGLITTGAEVEACGECGDMDWVGDLETDKSGKCVSTINNSKLILSNDINLKGKIALNEFTQRHRIRGCVPWERECSEREWTDDDDAGMRHYLESCYGLKGKSQIDDAWRIVARENRYHPVREYLNSLKWDGAHRLDTLFCDFLGAEDSEYVRTVTRKALVAAVARIFVPGIKYDQVLVLVGPQGCGKSQIIKRLGGEWFSDTLTTLQGKEGYEQIQGFWIIELAELSAMKRAEVETIKHFIAKSEDAYRAAYARNTEIYKRQCVFFGTTNKYEFLKDVTGNRRFWPIDLNPERARLNLWEKLDSAYVGQVWAESYELWKDGERLYIDDVRMNELAEAEQDKHLEENPLTEYIRGYLEMKLPNNWGNMGMYDRRSYIQTYEQQSDGIKLNERKKVCAMEVWCELLCGEKKDLDIRKSKEIKDIILKTGEWEQAKTGAWFGDVYGKQRGFCRI